MIAADLIHMLHKIKVQHKTLNDQHPTALQLIAINKKQEVSTQYIAYEIFTTLNNMYSMNTMRKLSCSCLISLVFLSSGKKKKDLLYGDK